MILQPFRQTALLLCAGLLLAVLVRAQAQAPAPARAVSQTQQLPPPDLKHALKSVAQGESAEKEGKIDDALLAYDEAARYAPRDPAIIAKGAVLRSKLVQVHTANAERLALDGHIAQAIEELRTAMRIDATNPIVAERIAEMQAMQRDEEAAKAASDIPGLPRARPQPGTHSFNFRGDTKTVYEQVAGAFGIKASFDPDLPARNVRLRIDDVDFNTAMSILGEQTATFWRPLSAALIFVAADTPEKRREYDLEAEETFPLSASVAPDEMTEILRALRDITGATRIELDTNSHTITMRDSPEHLVLAGRIINQIERARGELMLEIELLEVDKNKAQQLGITPPTSAQAFLLSTTDINALKQSADLSNALTILGQIFSAKGLSSVPPFTVVGGGYTTFLLTLPAAAANFSDALNLVQSGQQVLMRAQSSKPATFFVGDRFPVTLSLLSGSLGSSGTGSLLSSATGIPTGTTFPETSFNVGDNPVALVANNFSGGSLPDLAVANHNDNTISILINQDNGNFIAQTNSPFVLAKSETGPVSLATALLRTQVTPTNGTPTPDLVVANSGSNNVGVLFGNGDGTFNEASASPYKVGNTPSAVLIADFNGDGNPDFAVLNKGDNTISIFRGDGHGNFTAFPGSPFALQNNATVSEKGPVAFVAGNFRNATIGSTNLPEVDLAIVNQTTNNVAILLSSVDTAGNISFTEALNSPITVGSSPVAIATGDLNADGIPDLAVVNQGDDTISILLGSSNANGTFVAASGSPLPTAATPDGIVIASFTGGAVPDLAVTNQGVSTLAVYIGLGSGTFSNRIEVQSSTTPGAIISSTLTSSGLPDVAFVAQGTTANRGLVTIVQDSSSFASNGGVGSNQTPYPGSEYIDLGVKVKATPTLHPNREVTLQLEFEIRALAGSSVNGIPVISNRTLSQTVRVKEDETTLIGGLLDQEQTRAINGLPGLATLPGIGYAFGTRNNSNRDTEFLILVTPRRLRFPSQIAPAIAAGRGDPGGRAGARGAVPVAPEPAQPVPQPPPPQP
jgi:type II secretory pathway component GspD/PulD (secretin)